MSERSKAEFVHEACDKAPDGNGQRVPEDWMHQKFVREQLESCSVGIPVRTRYEVSPKGNPRPGILHAGGDGGDLFKMEMRESRDGGSLETLLEYGDACKLVVALTRWLQMMHDFRKGRVF